MSRRSAKQSGFTLFELVLVLALLIVVMALSVPVIDTMMDETRLTAANDTIRARLTDARAQAINDGIPYHFKFKENTGDYRVEPDFQSVDKPQTDETVNAKGLMIQGTLPDKVMFLPGSQFETDPNGWQIAVTFLPDGTGRWDANIFYGKDAYRSVARFRALTGTVTVSPMVDDNAYLGAN